MPVTHEVAGSSPVVPASNPIRNQRSSESTLALQWMEANVLLPRRLDPGSKEPDYNIEVWIEPAARR
jgi:hypothetical protein